MTPQSIQITSRAKINWLLHVGPLRSDGYHDIITIFQELNLGETMQFTAQPEHDQCILTGYPADIDPEDNLVTRAWHMLRKLCPDRVHGIHVSIEKTLPQGGGLGGGSSNAAATLNALNILYNLDLPIADLERLAGMLGSDIPFFIRGGTALATGRGEILSPLPPAPIYWFVLQFPTERMSTADAYRQLDSHHRVEPSQHTLSKFLTTLHHGDPILLAPLLFNDFEIVAEKYFWFTDARQKLSTAGALATLLCGSGSTVCGLCRDEQHANEVAQKAGGTVVSTFSKARPS